MDSGLKIQSEGGEPANPAIKPAAASFGTTVEARELFFNLPARQKFLKGQASEAAACTETLLRLSLTRPDVGFSLLQDRREVFAVAPVQQGIGERGEGLERPERQGSGAKGQGLEQNGEAPRPLRPNPAPLTPSPCFSRADPSHLPAAPFFRSARELLGRTNTESLVELDAVGCRSEELAAQNPPVRPIEPGVLALPEIPLGYRLFGLLSPPAVTRPNRSAIYLNVNGRPVKDRTLTSALLEACRQLLPPKRYPIAVLYLELPGADVDANVHPTKTEVRFRVPGLVYALLHHAVRQGLGQQGLGVRG